MIFNYNKVYNYQFVSVVIPSANNARVYFPDLPNLREVYTIGVSMYSYYNFTQDPNGLTISSLAGNGAFVTLVEGSTEKFQQLDGCTLNPIAGRPDTWSDVGGMFSIKPTKFDYSKSYIQFYNGFTPVTNTVIPLGIYYLYPNEYKALQQQQ